MKDKLIKESKKLDDLIAQHAITETPESIIFLYANMDKLKFMSASEINDERQNTIVRYMKSIFTIKDYEENEIRQILTKHGILNHHLTMWIGFITCLILANSIIVWTVYNFGFNIAYILLVFGSSIFPILLIMAIVEHLSRNTKIRFYRIPRQYCNVKIEKNSLKGAKFW